MSQSSEQIEAKLCAYLEGELDEQGRAEIEKMYREGFERRGVAASARIDSKQLVVDGDLAYESGYGEVGRIKEGKVATSGGRYLTVWQRRGDGEWKIIRNIVLP